MKENLSEIVCDDVTTGDAAKKDAGVSPVDGKIRQDAVREENTAPRSVVICDDIVRNEEMIHPAAKEGAGVAVIVLLKAQKVNAAMYTVHIYKPIEGIIDFKRFFIVIQCSY